MRVPEQPPIRRDQRPWSPVANQWVPTFRRAGAELRWTCHDPQNVHPRAKLIPECRVCADRLDGSGREHRGGRCVLWPAGVSQRRCAVPVSQRFRHMRRVHVRLRGEIGDRPGDAEGALPRPRRQSEAIGGVAKEGEGRRIEYAGRIQRAWRDAGIEGGETCLLSQPCGSHLCPQRVRFPLAMCGLQCGHRHRAHADVQIDAVREWSGDPPPVLRQRAIIAVTGDGWMVRESAGARVHGHHKQHVAGETDASVHAGDVHRLPLSESLCVSGHVSLCASSTACQAQP